MHLPDPVATLHLEADGAQVFFVLWLRRACVKTARRSVYVAVSEAADTVGDRIIHIFIDYLELLRASTETSNAYPAGPAAARSVCYASKDTEPLLPGRRLGRLTHWHRSRPLLPPNTEARERDNQYSEEEQHERHHQTP